MAAGVTGTTFNFNKSVTDGEPSSTPDKPADGAKVETKIAGEKTKWQNLKDFVRTTKVMQTVNAAISSTIQNIEGAQLSEQANALQSITNSVTSVFMAATNPYALVTMLACKGISYGFQVMKYNREKAWERYDIEEYRAARGYSAGNRSRNG